jgi:hypothetical protein
MYESDDWLEKLHENRLAGLTNAFLKIRPILKDLTDNALCKNCATRGHIDWDSWSVSLFLYEYDLPTVIDHVAGPFHRKYNVDWTLRVPWGQVIKLSTITKTNIHVKIFINEDSMRSCIIRQVATRKKTKEEIENDIRSATETDVYENVIDCAEEI